MPDPTNPRAPRSISFTEVDVAMTCQARWDFSYGGRLAGDTLRPRQLAAVLSDGRAWGAAVAAWHERSGELLAPWYAHAALAEQLSHDRQEQRDAGWIVDEAAEHDRLIRLSIMLDHYIATARPFPNLTRMERWLEVPIPSRGGVRASNRWRFLCRIDGWTIDEDGRPWIVEFKLRSRLTDVRLIQRGRQYRWYPWAWSRVLHEQPFGIYVEERLNEIPQPPRRLKGRATKHNPHPRPTLSTAKDQMTTPELYLEACREHGVTPDVDALTAFQARVWQHRVPIEFRASELYEAGQELISAAKLIRDLDTGELYPVRNAKRGNCGYCQFKEICDEPQDRLYVDSLFERRPPKRLRNITNAEEAKSK